MHGPLDPEHRAGPVLVEAVDAADRLDGELFLLHAVPVSFAERSVGLDEAVHRGERLPADATTMAIARGRAPKEAHLVRVRPHELVGEGLDADILVVGGPRPGGSGRLGRVVGSAAGTRRARSSWSPARVTGWWAAQARGATDSSR